MASLAIYLPTNFTVGHEQAVTDYLASESRGRANWKRMIVAFNRLDEATLVTAEGRQGKHTFRDIYMDVVDKRLADSYIKELFALDDVAQDSPALWASYARQIMTECRQRRWQEKYLRNAYILVSYLLYWWNAFARGYAFEVEIFRDLQNSHITFQPHDLLDRQARYSPSDLLVSGMAGDIKTSTYFIQVTEEIRHDFYIVRLHARGRAYLLAVMLQPAAWDVINGDTIDGTLDTIVTQLSQPVRIKKGHHELITLNYTEWKRRILRLQGESL